VATTIKFENYTGYDDDDDDDDDSDDTTAEYNYS
jgi:hypothetical protein